MNDKHYTEIDPLEKESEILSLFKEYNPKSFGKNNDGFDWIEEEDSRCVVFFNPYYDNNLEINIEDMGEFTVYFGNNHIHYLAYQDDYERMLDLIKEILSNDICAAELKDSADKWFGSCYLGKSEIGKDPVELFGFCFKEKEFSNHLIESGYSVSFSFWNPVDNTTITLPAGRY